MFALPCVCVLPGKARGGRKGSRRRGEGRRRAINQAFPPQQQVHMLILFILLLSTGFAHYKRTRNIIPYEFNIFIHSYFQTLFKSLERKTCHTLTFFFLHQKLHTLSHSLIVFTPLIKHSSSTQQIPHLQSQSLIKFPRIYKHY